jgi:hypothetical protein
MHIVWNLFIAVAVSVFVTGWLDATFSAPSTPHHFQLVSDAWLPYFVLFVVGFFSGSLRYWLLSIVSFGFVACICIGLHFLK